MRRERFRHFPTNACLAPCIVLYYRYKVVREVELIEVVVGRVWETLNNIAVWHEIALTVRDAGPLVIVVIHHGLAIAKRRNKKETRA